MCQINTLNCLFTAVLKCDMIILRGVYTSALRVFMQETIGKKKRSIIWYASVGKM